MLKCIPLILGIINMFFLCTFELVLHNFFSYPLNPPVVRFLTKILHPNISRHGDVGIDCIHHNWSLALTISKVLISIQSLLTDPYTKVRKQIVVPLLDQFTVTEERT